MDMDKLCALAVEAGRAVMEVYQAGFEVMHKEDGSPLTSADLRSHEIISAGLGSLYPDVPVISEEGAGVPFETRRAWRRFFLVDPLDGTKQFVRRIGEFTVNIALIEDEEPVLGVIYVPVRDVTYFARKGAGAFRRLGATMPVGIRTAKPAGAARTVVTSRSHPSGRLEKYLEGVEVKARLTAGSSLKFCMVAEGTADLYPRMGPTWEWDTAAGHAIVSESGGSVKTLEGGPLTYNKPDLLNGSFVVSA